MKKISIILFVLVIYFYACLLSVKAEVAGLTLCRDSAAFHKRLTNSVKKLELRLAKYQEDSPPAIALTQQIDKTRARFASYERGNTLCGTDGLPHLITDGRWSHAREFILPSILFLYITGWIGWVGRGYLQAVKKDSKPAEKEIIIDVSLALRFMISGFLWPFSAIQEFTSNKLIANSDEITISPR